MSLNDDVLEDFRGNISKSLDSLKVDLGKLRTGRASISILDGVRVDYYGTLTPLAQCANLNVADARLITIKPYDRSIITEIERAIAKADLGLNPQNDGELIRLPIPPLNEERRKDLCKQARARGEEAKISVRNGRRDANEMLKEGEKDKEISQDDLKRSLDKVQEETDKGIKKVEEMITKKEKEILEI